MHLHFMSSFDTEMAQVVEPPPPGLSWCVRVCVLIPVTYISLELHSKNQGHILVVQREPTVREVSLQYDVFFGMEFMIFISPWNNV